MIVVMPGRTPRSPRPFPFCDHRHRAAGARVGSSAGEHVPGRADPAVRCLRGSRRRRPPCPRAPGACGRPRAWSSCSRSRPTAGSTASGPRSCCGPTAAATRRRTTSTRRSTSPAGRSRRPAPTARPSWPCATTCSCSCPGGRVEVDVDAFDAAVARARETGAVADLRAALALHGGELLPEDRYEPWASGRREALSEAHLGLLLDLAGRLDRGRRGRRRRSRRSSRRSCSTRCTRAPTAR